MTPDTRAEYRAALAAFHAASVEHSNHSRYGATAPAELRAQLRAAAAELLRHQKIAQSAYAAGAVYPPLSLPSLNLETVEREAATEALCRTGSVKNAVALLNTSERRFRDLMIRARLAVISDY